MKHYIFWLTGLLLIFNFCSTPASAQKRKNKHKAEDTVIVYDLDTLIRPVPNNRASFHVIIDREQKRADGADGVPDGLIRFSQDSAYNRMLSRAILTQVDQLQVMIENLPGDPDDRLADNQERIRYLRALSDMVRRYNADPKADPAYYRKLVANFKAMLIARHEDRLPEFV